MKLVLERQIQLAFVCALVLLLVTGFFTYRNARSMSEAIKWESHTRDVLLKLEDTLKLAVDSETGGRGFIITGNEDFLAANADNAGKISRNITELRALVSDNPKQTAELDALEKAINEKSGFGRMLIDTRRSRGIEATRAIIDSGQGRQIMSAMRSSGDKMKDEEQTLLLTREAELDKSINDTLFFLFFGTAAGIVSIGLANWAIFREVRIRRRAQNELRVANKDLETRVDARTLELNERNAELKEQIQHGEQSENRRRIALEAGSLGTWILDPKNNRAEIDERSLALFGLAAQDFDGSGEKVFSRIHREDFPNIEQLFQKTVLERANFNAEFRVEMPDGSVRWNQCHGQPQIGEHGEITHVVGHCRDVTERKRNELTLRESEIFTRSILDSLPAHIAVVDKNGVITAVNQAWQNFAQSNCLEEQIGKTGVGQNYVTVCRNAQAFEADTKEILDNLQSVLKNETSGFTYEYPCHSPSEERWFILQVSAMRGAEKGGAVISHIDITARKKAERDLSRSKEQLDFILETSQLGVWNMDLRTGRTIRSPRHDQIFGYDEPLPDWTYEIFLGYVLPEDRPEVDKKFQTALKENKAWDFEARIRRHDGETRWIWARGQAIPGDDGAAIQMLGTVADITTRKKAEIELKNSEQFNRSIFENSPDCIKVLELDGTLSRMNTNGLCILEVDDFEYFAGRQWVDFWDGDENELAYQAVQSAAKGKPSRFEGFCKTAKGTDKYWDVSVAPVFDAEGKPNRLISTSRDLTERREGEREREELLKREQTARRDAEIANRMRDEFLATVSHELRAPLSSILGWARLMEKGKLDETTRQKAVGTIVRNAESQNRLIEDLLDVSRIISGKLRLEVITLKPINVVESALETVRPAAEAKGIRLEIKETPDVSHIVGDPNRLQQVIWNLLSNAIKFTPNGGEVSVGIERRDDYTEIKVTDTGVGIKDEFLPHVFERFRQADASSIRKFGGLGLGLAIVRHITEMHGGTVRVESAGENAGSTFIVRLPLVSSDSEDNNAAATDEFLPKPLETTRDFNLAGLLILVVDDEQDTRQLLVQALTFNGATVETASSAHEALEVIETKNPDVLVSDIGMPDEDGYTLIRKVRALADARYKNIPAVALTAFTRAQDRMRALSAGYQNHVSKPVDLDELATVIASLTGRLRINDED